jgi:hypothetical protein
MKEIHPELQERIKIKLEAYQKVTAFAQKLPLFEKQIIQDEQTGDTFFKVASGYKGVYFSWGINWHCGRPPNYPENEPCELGLIGVYLNRFDLFDEDMYEFASKELKDKCKNIKYYFYDISNSTLYFKPEEVEGGLDAIVEWYTKTKSETDSKLKEIKRNKLEAELRALDR